MTLLIIVLVIALILIILMQIGKVIDLSSDMKGGNSAKDSSDYWNSKLILIFGFLLMIIAFGSAYYYKNYMLGYGPHTGASAHGGELDAMFHKTTMITLVVFVITNMLLFYFAFRYRHVDGKKSLFIPHDNRLEMLWTALPAVVMTYLVIFGLLSWNSVMADIEPGEEHIELEAMGVQFNWLLRYPGPDNKLGSRYFKNINGSNPIGQIWTDKNNLDDFQPSEIVLPVNKQVKINIAARDVLHSFFLPHMRVKMDAVPGMPTYFVFTPTLTTEQYRDQLSKYPEYQIPSDPAEPDGPQKWETFEYELACAELCGNGHFSMRKVLRVVSQAEYDKWVASQSSFFMTNIRGTDADPFLGTYLPSEIASHDVEFKEAFEKAYNAENAADRFFNLKYVTYNTSSASLSDLSQYELKNVINVMKKYPNMEIRLGGHTDNQGDADGNMELSKARALNVQNYLIKNGVSASRLSSKGYGQNQPIADNNTAEGRLENRRTEFIITKK